MSFRVFPELCERWVISYLESLKSRGIMTKRIRKMFDLSKVGK